MRNITLLLIIFSLTGCEPGTRSTFLINGKEVVCSHWYADINRDKCVHLWDCNDGVKDRSCMTNLERVK